MKLARIISQIVGLLATAISCTVVVACPSNQYESCIFNACVCLPKCGGAICDGVQHIKNETTGQVGGAALEVWINNSYNSAIGTSQPIPPQIRAALTGYIENDILNRARYKVGDNGILNLAGLTIAYGDKVTGSTAAAVTVVNLIVFRDASDAQSNPALWAHELTHVKQYRDWGTHDFAIRYARNSNGVEDPAYAVQNAYPNWRASQGGAGNNNGGGPFQGAGGMLPGTVMQPCGCWGPPQAVVSEPRCQSRAVSPVTCGGVCPMGGSPYAWTCR